MKKMNGIILQLGILQLFSVINVISECVNNANYAYSTSWGKSSKVFAHKGVITPNFAENVNLREWTLKIEFAKELLGFQTWVAEIRGKIKGSKTVTLQAKDYNYSIRKNTFTLAYIADLEENLRGFHFLCAQFCGKLDGSDEIVCPSNPTIPTTGAPLSSSRALTSSASSRTITTATAIPDTTESITSGPTVTDSTSCAPRYDYADVLGKSLLFYEAQRSGKLPSSQRVTWRKDSALADGSTQTPKIDLSGGYYDAGDHMKFGFPMASAITNLAWGMIAFKEGYKNSGQYKYGLEALKWATDYFIKCHPSKFVFYGQVGDGGKDHGYWGRPEDMTMERLVYKIDQYNPGSELAGETAAAMAACSLVFRDAGEVAYADKLVNHAKDLYEFADKYRGEYSSSITNAANFYKSYSGFEDELAWASLWLFKATDDISYKTEYLNNFDDMAKSKGLREFSWDNKWAGVIVLASQLKISNHLNNLKNLLSENKFTPKGLFFVDKWGATRHAANLAFLSLIASEVDQVNKDFYRKFTRGQINYILGDGGRSYVVGFGKNPPQRPHHRSSSCPLAPKSCGWVDFNSDKPNPQVLVGALVAGPDGNDNYEDSRSDFVKNEVALDYNAGFQSAIAGLAELAYKGDC